MAVAKKPTREQSSSKSSLDEVISKGGSSPKKESSQESQINFVQLRLPQNTVDEIDELIDNKVPKPTRHHWLLEAVYEKLNREKEKLQ